MVFIHITLPFGAKDSSKIKSEPSLKDGPRSIGRQKDLVLWDPKRGTLQLYSRRVALERCCIPSMCPECLHLLASTLSSAVELLTNRRGLSLQVLRLHLSCYSSALCSDKCLLCHSSLLQSNRFLLPLPYTLPPSFYPRLPVFLLHLHSLTHTQMHTLTHEEPEYKWGVFLKDMIVLLDDFFLSENEGVGEKDAISKSLRFLWWAKLSVSFGAKPQNSLLLSGRNINSTFKRLGASSSAAVSERHFIRLDCILYIGPIISETKSCNLWWKSWKQMWSTGQNWLLSLWSTW